MRAYAQGPPTAHSDSERDSLSFQRSRTRSSTLVTRSAHVSRQLGEQSPIVTGIWRHSSQQMEGVLHISPPSLVYIIHLIRTSIRAYSGVVAPSCRLPSASPVLLRRSRQALNVRDAERCVKPGGTDVLVCAPRRSVARRVVITSALDRRSSKGKRVPAMETRTRSLRRRKSPAGGFR